MKPKAFARRMQSGFSLIDALIAAVVLSIGLLALAALQASVTRNAADSRARTQIMAFVEQVVERQRAFGVSGNFALVPVLSLWSADEVVVTQNAAGVNNLNLTMSATRYDGRSGSFVLTTATLPASAPQYKILRSVATWTDASGQSRRLDLASVLSPRVISSSRLPYSASTGGAGSTAARPVVRIPTPADPGMIPVALGNGSQSAATNPRPEIVSHRGDEHVTETRFDILTYSPLQADATKSTVQSRVETVIVGCQCNKGAASGNLAYRPTYWDGSRYKAPIAATYGPMAGEATLSNASPPQSDYCDVCCRDHHDPANLPAKTPKFDPFRFAKGEAHDHFKIVNGSLVLAGEEDDYLEACRLIRVDGFLRVAADMNNEFFNLLATNKLIGSATGVDYAPTKTASDKYQSFVLNYLDNRILKQTSLSSYNTPLVDVDSSSIDEPSDPVKLGKLPDFKWLHSRGLYIDYLEEEALNKLVLEKQNCDTSVSTLDSCMLPHVPFTSINLTELSRWSPRLASDDQIYVTNSNFAESSVGSPVRGQVALNKNPVDGAERAAIANNYHSNSGLTALDFRIDDDEANLSDQQLFEIDIDGSDGSNSKFYVETSNYIISSGDLSVNSLYDQLGDCERDVAANPNDSVTLFTCNPSVVDLSTTVTISNYNYASTAKKDLKAYSGPITCTNGTVPVTLNVSIVDQNSNARPVCRNFAVTMTNPVTGFIRTVDPLNINKGTESTSFVGTVANAQTLSLNFTEENPIPATTYKCTYTVATIKVKSINDVTLIWDDNPCD